MLSPQQKTLIREHLLALETEASGFSADPEAAAIFEEFLREEEFGLAFDTACNFLGLQSKMTQEAENHIQSLIGLMEI